MVALPGDGAFEGAIGDAAGDVAGASAADDAAASAAEATEAGATARDHIALGIEDGGKLNAFAESVGARTLMQDPQWRQTLIDAASDSGTKFSVNLDGLAGNDVYSQVMGAAQRGAAGDGLTNWELAQLYQNGRLGTVDFYQNGQPVPNPFGSGS